MDQGGLHYLMIWLGQLRNEDMSQNKLPPLTLTTQVGRYAGMQAKP
jgi:hypothetical protein